MRLGRRKETKEGKEERSKQRTKGKEGTKGEEQGGSKDRTPKDERMHGKGKGEREE